MRFFFWPNVYIYIYIYIYILLPKVLIFFYPNEKIGWDAAGATILYIYKDG